MNNFYGEGAVAQVQQNSPGASQAVSSAPSIAELEDLVREIKSNADRLDLEAEAAQELETELKTLAAQLGSPRPKPLILRESGGTVMRILEGAAGDVAAGLLLKYGPLLLRLVQGGS